MTFRGFLFLGTCQPALDTVEKIQSNEKFCINAWYLITGIFVDKNIGVW